MCDASPTRSPVGKPYLAYHDRKLTAKSYFTSVLHKKSTRLARSLGAGRSAPPALPRFVTARSRGLVAADPLDNDSGSRERLCPPPYPSDLSRSSINTPTHPSGDQHESKDMPFSPLVKSQCDETIRPSTVSSRWRNALRDALQSRTWTSLCSLNTNPDMSSRSVFSHPFQAGRSGAESPTTMDWVRSIKVRLSDNKLREEILRAALDTQCKRVNLLSLDAWERLNKHWNYPLEPCAKMVRPLRSESQTRNRIPVIGIAKGVIWHFLKGPRTYISDFYVIDMKDYDVVIGQKTIAEYALVLLGPDVPSSDR